jgi:hypothetical protein
VAHFHYAWTLFLFGPEDEATEAHKRLAEFAPYGAGYLDLRKHYMMDLQDIKSCLVLE